MGGWSGQGKDTTKWDGDIVANYFYGDGSRLTGISTSSTKILCIPVTNPTASDNFLIFRAPTDITITAIYGIVMNGTSVAFKINECDANGGSAAQVCDSCTAATTNTTATITNPNIDAGDYLSYTSTANTGGVTKLIITIEYT